MLIDFAMNVHYETSGRGRISIKKYHSTLILTCPFSLWVCHAFCPHLTPRDLFHIRVWDLEQNADTKRPRKKALAAQETFSHIKFSPAPCSHSEHSRQECVCKVRYRLLQPPVVLREKAQGHERWRYGGAEERKMVIMGREIERVSWDGKGLNKEHELRGKERLGAEGLWPWGIFRKLERDERAIHHLTCYPNAAKSWGSSSLLVSSGCGGNVLCLPWEEHLPSASGSSLWLLTL